MRDEIVKLLEPIEGPNPAGTYLRNEPGDDGLTVYDKIKKARTEVIDSLTGDRTPPDYAEVQKLAEGALAEQSKDIQLAAWLTEALLKRNGIEGLRDGLDLMLGLLEQFWDHLHPELEDGDAEMRAMPLNWVGDYLDVSVRFAPLTNKGHGYFEYQEALSIGYEAEANADSGKQSARAEAIEAGKLTIEEFDKAFTATPKLWYKQLVADTDSCAGTIDSLDRLGSEKFGSDAPSFRKLRDALTDVQVVANQLLAKKLEVDPDPVEPEPTEEEEEEEVAATPEPAATQLSAEPSSRQDAASHVAAAARFLQRDNPTNPAPYLMLRGFRWGELRASGGEVDPRALSAPPTNVRTKLKGLLLDAKWSELLAACESVMASPHGRGWLDLQRYVLTALEALGDEYEHVAAAVRGALVQLLRDLPELPQLTLMDDTPTANAETRAWLRELFATAPGGVEQTLGTLEGEDSEISTAVPPRAVKAAADRAAALVRSGQHQKAIQLLMSQSEQEKCARDRFLRRTEAADIMVEAGHEAVAAPILQELAAKIDEHNLESWEAGDTVARPLSLLHRCMQTLGTDSDAALEALYLRICRLDPLRAISFPGNETTATDMPAVPDNDSASLPAPKTTDAEVGSGGSIDAGALLDQLGNS